MAMLLHKFMVFSYFWATQKGYWDMLPVRIATKFTTLVMLMGWLIAGAAQAASDRVALVIGNTIYDTVAPLKNAGNDANGMAAAFENIGFDVTRAYDLSYAELSNTLREFNRKATGSEIAVVYYAGHGIEIDKNNYLIPTDARLERATDVYFEAVPMESAMLAVEGATELSLVILDACRNNPFAARMSRSGTSRAVTVGRGLALVEPSGNSLVAFAAKSGTTAADGEGDNSPYAIALMAALQEPNVELSLLFRKVRDDVLAATDGAQEPFVYGSLSAKELFLNMNQSQEPAVQGTDQKGDVQANLSGQFEPAYVTWTAIQSLGRGDSQQRALEAFVQEFGRTRYAAAAKVMLQSYGVTAELPKKLAMVRTASVSNAVPQPVPQPVLQAVPETLDLSPTGEDVALNRDQRRMIQRGLAASGYAVGGIDGLFGPKTRAAIVSWQDIEGLRVTSYLSQEQADRLMSIGRSQPVATPHVKQAATAPASSVTKPVSAAPQGTQMAAIAPPKTSAAPSGKLYMDLNLSISDEGYSKNFSSAISVRNGNGGWAAKNSQIGRFGPLAINYSINGNTVSYSGTVKTKSFGGTSQLINGNMTKKITLLIRGSYHIVRLRVKFTPT